MLMSTRKHALIVKAFPPLPLESSLIKIGKKRALLLFKLGKHNPNVWTPTPLYERKRRFLVQIDVAI